MEIQFAWSGLGESFVHDLQSLDGDIICGCVEAGSAPLGSPRIDEVPANLLSVAGLVDQDDGAIFALGLPLDDRLPPVPEAMIVGHAVFERDIAVLVETGQLAGDISLFVAFAVVDGIGAGIQPGAFAKSGTRDSVDLQFEVKCTIWIFPVGSGHGCSLSSSKFLGC